MPKLLQVIYPRLPPLGKVFWNHEAGPKTIFFWAPTFKWGLVLAGIADVKRPVEKISVYQVYSLIVFLAHANL